jgi:hypothetical protein
MPPTSSGIDALGSVGIDVAEYAGVELLGTGIVPGPTSGMPIKVRRACEKVTREGDKRENSYHQWHKISWSPSIPLSGMCCEYIIEKESLVTNCDVEGNSPIGDICPHGYRIREPAYQQQCHIQQILHHDRNSQDGKQILYAVESKIRPAKCRHISPGS